MNPTPNPRPRGYDAPAVVDVELVDGRKKRFLADALELA